MREVKCKICGKKVPMDQAYKIEHMTSSGRVSNFYYCNEQEYKDHQLQMEYKNKVYMIINDIFGYKIINSAIYKEISSITDEFGYEKVFKYLESNKSYLSNTMTRDFSSEYGKIRYFSTIIKNKIKDYTEESKQVIKEVDTTDFDVVTKKTSKPRKKRRALVSIEEEV